MMYTVAIPSPSKKNTEDRARRGFFDRLLEALNAGDETLSEMFRRHSHEEWLPYESFARRVRTILRAESCAVFLVRKEGDHRFLELISEDCDSGFRYPSPTPKLSIRSRKRGGLTSHLANSGRIVRLHGSSLRESPYLAGNKALHLNDGVDYSLLSFPLKNRKGQLLGLVKVQNKKGRHGKPGPRIRFSDSDVSLAAFLSTRLVVALQGFEFGNFLHTLARGKASSDDPSIFQTRTLAQALNLAGADRGSIALWDEHRKALVVTAQVGDEPWKGRRVPSRSVMHRVWKDRKSIVVPDVRKYDGPYYASHPSTRSEIAVLASARDSAGQLQPIGVLNAESSSPSTFDLQDQKMLEVIGELLAATIISSRPEMSLRETLASLSAPARVFAEPKKLLSNILERLRHTYGFDRGLVYVAEEMSNVLRLGALMGVPEHQHLVGTYTHKMTEESLAALVWRTGDPVYSEKPRRDERVSTKGLDLFRIEGPLLGLPLVHSGKVLGVLVCWSTEGPRPRHEHQRELAPFAQVTAAEIAISDAYQLLDEWIHNIAQPSQTLGGLVLQIGRARDEPDFQIELMSTLKSEIERLVRIVTRSRLMRRHQRVPPEQKVYRLFETLQNAVHAFQRQADERGITLELGLDVPQEAKVFGDESRIAIALGELLGNALKHSNRGGVVQVRLTQEKEQYRVCIIDNGDGVPEAWAQRIFDPYFSLPLRGERAGTGLGLTIASGIVSEGNGRLLYSPNGSGTGSVFTMDLPQWRNCE